jgi:hypothetical protein
MNSLKSFAMNCGPLLEMIRGAVLRMKILGSPQDYLDVGLRHRLPQIRVDDVSAAAVQNAAQVVERPADVDG